MTKQKYTRNPVVTTVLKCTWTLSGKPMTYDYIFPGDPIGAIIGCYSDVLWAKMPDFSISLKSYTIHKK
jgi:hypothetical protein